VSRRRPKRPSTKNLRDHGLVDCGKVLSKPKVTKVRGAPGCPNCGCETFQVTLLVENKILRGKTGLATYFGCPACPYASPAMIAATTPGAGESAGEA